MKKLLTLASAAILASACTTFDPYTGEEKATHTSMGASIGASIAAVLAYLDNKDQDSTTRNQRILKAAAAGGAIGGGIGYYMDVQEAKLRKQLRSTGVSVQRDGDNINLIMPGNITFDTDSATIQTSFVEVLESVTLVLKEFDRTIVVVAGHTDSTGSEQHNQTLSELRAQTVANFFRDRQILGDRLEVIGFGESQPVADNGTEDGRELNRRVEITLIPVAEQ